ALLGLRLGHALDVSAEVLPPHDILGRCQRIALCAYRLKPALNIEKARLPHDSLARSAHGPLRSASQIRSDLARRIFRGAQGPVPHHQPRPKALLIMCWPAQGRFAANPEKARTRDAPRTSTASGMPNAMPDHIARIVQGAGPPIPASASVSGGFGLSAAMAAAASNCSLISV